MRSRSLALSTTLALVAAGSVVYSTALALALALRDRELVARDRT
jgi:hypothetical protein